MQNYQDELNNLDYDLESEWTFWIDNNSGLLTSDDYKKNQKSLGKFNTVKTFWRYFNFVPDVSMLHSDCSYHLMKDDLKPYREEHNNGGQIRITFEKKYSVIFLQKII